MAADSTEYTPTYRQEDVDQTLDEHDSRISRLEKAGLIVVGYAFAEGGNLVTQIAGVL